MGTADHKSRAPVSVRAAVITLSTSRGLDSDQSGRWICSELRSSGHQVLDHRVVADDAPAIQRAVREVIGRLRPDVLLLTGGTGIAPKDVTIETLRPMFQKELTAFGALFAQLSMEEIGSAAIMSRATAGVIERCVVFCMPGSLKACRLACRRLIFPELGHLAGHLKEV
jgi:molybdenum cofactor biosynthesis protein B